MTNWDVTTSLIVFRLHDSMVHWDDYIYSDCPMYNRFGSHTARAIFKPNEACIARMEAIDEHNRVSNKYPKGKLAPVPYIALYDNCFNGVTKDLTRPWPLIERAATEALDGMFSIIEDEGIAFYASTPGNDSATVPGFDKNAYVDNHYVGTYIGPLARRFVLLLSKHSGSPVTFEDIWQGMQDPVLDKETQPARTFSNPKSEIRRLVLSDGVVKEGLSSSGGND